jgi:hypothetical protein
VNFKNHATKQYIANDGSNTNSVIASPPVANARPNQSVQSSQTVQINSSASSDPNEFTPLTYNWT